MSQPPYASAPPPGTYGPPPGRPIGGTSKGVIVAIIVGVLVVVGGGAAAAILLLGRDDETSTESPLDTAEAFAAAWRDGDCDTLESLVTDRFLEAAPADCRADEISGDPGDPEITEESDDKATAVMGVDGSTWELELVNEGGSWLIDGIGAGSSTAIEPDVEPSPASSDAQELVATYVEAMRAGGCAKIEAMSSQSLNSSTDCQGDIVPPADVAVELGDPQMVGDTAATIPATIDGEQTRITLMLTQEGGERTVAQLDVAR